MSNPNKKESHDKHHNAFNRRTFLKNIGLFSVGTVALPNMTLSNLFSPNGGPQGERDRILVLIRLKGGNDGLNTIIPTFDYGTYSEHRPNLKIDNDDLIALNEKYAVPNYASSFKDMWESGSFKIINNVGYETPNLSHFSSSDIWDSASKEKTDSSGWIGRLLDDEYPDFFSNPPIDPVAIQIGGNGGVLVNNEDGANLSINASNPTTLNEIAETGSLFPFSGDDACQRDIQKDFIRGIANSTFKQSGTIHDAYIKGQNSSDADYHIIKDEYHLGDSLATVAKLIKGGLKTQIYIVTLDGFDTHGSQESIHPFLIHDLSKSIKAFYTDLKEVNKDSEVLSVTFSEFGRRVNENGSGGTDHGAAAPMMVFGSAVQGSEIVGTDIDLDNLLKNNLQYDIDFRRVYSTLLNDWLCVPPTTSSRILKGTYDTIDLGFSCQSTSTSINNFSNQADLFHQIRYEENGNVNLFFILNQSAKIEIKVFDMVGKLVGKAKKGIFSSGQNQFSVSQLVQNKAIGVYIYKLYVDNKTATGKFMLN